MHSILSTTQNDAPIQQWALPWNIIQRCTDGLRYRAEFSAHVQTITEKFGQEFDDWENALRQVQQIGGIRIRPDLSGIFQAKTAFAGSLYCGSP